MLCLPRKGLRRYWHTRCICGEPDNRYTLPVMACDYERIVNKLDDAAANANSEAFGECSRGRKSPGEAFVQPSCE